MPESALHQDVPFRHYTLRHRLTAWISLRLFDNARYTVRNGLLKGSRRRGGLGWIPELLARTGMTAEQQFWRSLNLTGLTVYDIGAFHGLLTLHFALQAETVICFEPNTENYKRLLENVALNGMANVEARKIGIGACAETRRMVGAALMPGGASVDQSTVRELLRTGRETAGEQIPMATLDQEIALELPPPDLIKIDIEGCEMEALRGARRTLAVHKPALFLEMHGETVREKRRKTLDIVTFLWSNDYRRIRHIESGTAITPDNAATAIEGHLYFESA